MLSLGCSNVVLLFLHTSERFLQNDQLIIRLQVVVVKNFIRMLMRNVFVNVFKSDAVISWAAIFRRRPQATKGVETLQPKREGGKAASKKGSEDRPT